MIASNYVSTPFYVVAFAALLAFIYNLRPLLRVRAGKSGVASAPGIATAVRNAVLLGLAQARVYDRRFGYAAVMHFLLAWGFIELLFATTVGFFVARDWFTAILPGKDVAWFAALNDLGGLMLCAGIVMALLRRHAARPQTLPQAAFAGRGHLLGDTGLLLLLLVLAIGGFVAEAARLGIEQPAGARFSFVGHALSQLASQTAWSTAMPAIWWGHAITSLAFVAILPATKMFHAIAATVNVALTDTARRGQLEPMHVSRIMEDPDADLDKLTLGASRAIEFPRKQLLDTIACTECARCTEVCPAHAVERPLSPMKLISDIRNDLYGHGNRHDEAANLVGTRIDTDELWSCTTCGACTEACPVLVDHVPIFTNIRRYLVMSEGRPPEQAGPRLESMLEKGNPWGFPARDRTRWASDAGLELPLMRDKKQAEVLYWVGCAGAYDPRNQQVARAMVKLLQAADVDFAVLGDEESCTGDSARRMGEEYLFESLALQNVELLRSYDFDKIVTPCPHCYQTLSRDYSDFGGDFEVAHHSQYIAGLIRDERLQPAKRDGSVTFHDPCYLGRHNGEFDAPRKVLRATLDRPATLIEMERSRDHGFCCGAGGGNMWFDLDKGRRMNVERLRQATATGAQTVATACSFCTIMMEDARVIEADGAGVTVKDIAEIVADQIDDD